MDRDRLIQIVVAEAEPHAGMLRSVLEREGFEIVGRATNDYELFGVLERAHPSVIVVDAGISAAAALEARQHGAVLVVWPKEVAPVNAEERVDPDHVFEDLPAAVRRAAMRRGVFANRAPDLVVLPELAGEVDARALAAPLRTLPPRRSRRSVRRAPLAAAAVFVMYAIAASAFAVGVTGGLVAMSDRAERERPTESEASRPAGEDPGSRDEPAGTEEPSDVSSPGESNGRAANELPREEPDDPGVTTENDGRGTVDAIGGGVTGAVTAENGEDGEATDGNDHGNAGNASDGHGNADGDHGNADGDHGNNGGAEHGAGNGQGGGSGRAKDDPSRADSPGGGGSRGGKSEG